MTRYLGLAFRSPTTWGKWDTGLYLEIADKGYSLNHCINVPNRTPQDWCGTGGWFPGYPMVTRAVRDVFNWRTDMAALVVSRTAFFVLLAVLWFGFLRDRPRRDAFYCLAFACLFPGGVYYLALFPMSLATVGLLIALLGVRKKQSALLFLGAALAAFTYPIAVFGGLSITAALLIHPQTRRSHLGQATCASAGSLVGFLATCTIFRTATGHWNAFFLAQAGYHHPKAFPPIHILGRILPIMNPARPDEAVPAAQYLYVLVVLSLVTWTFLRKRQWPSPLEFSIATMVLVIYFASNYYGVGSSQFRHQSLLLPLVLLSDRLTKARPALLIVSAVITLQMTALFVTGTIV